MKHQVNIEIEMIIDDEKKVNMFEEVGESLREFFLELNNLNKNNFSFNFKCKEILQTVKDIQI